MKTYHILLKLKTERLRVNKKTNCWEWQLSKQKGYGVLRFDKIAARTHRIAYSLLVGHIPKGMHILHSCDNPSCINPCHLSVGTASDNALDKERKGRSNHTILLPEDVYKIRAMLRRGKATLSEIGKQFGVSRDAIWKISKNQNCKRL